MQRPPRTFADRYISPLRYPGGKSKAAEWLVDLFDVQSRAMDVEVWIEPFAGGAGAGLTAALRYDVPEVWLNEKDPALAEFWRAAFQRGDELADHVATLIVDLDLFYESKQVLDDARRGRGGHTSESIALAVLIVNRCSRSGILTAAAGPIGGVDQAGRDAVGARFNGPALADRIRRIASLGSRVQVSSADGVACVQDIAGSGIEHEVFLFVDPPYLEQGNRLYQQGMSLGEHQSLAAALRACPAPWVATYDAVPEVLDLYPDCAVIEYQLRYTCQSRRTATEYAILGPHLAVPRPGDRIGNPVSTGEWWWAS